VPIPRIFFALNQETVSKTQELMEIATGWFFRLLNHPISTTLESNLRLCADCLPNKANIAKGKRQRAEGRR
jgi:hypothetical protein